MAELPIIVLAFANEQEGRRYLRDLPEELRQLQVILAGAERQGLCRVEVRPNATLEQIFDVFTKNRDQVTILHYAGHADSGRLLLESSAAGGAPAHAAGLATFLAQRRGLQLVFLNGCSTRAQAAGLLDAGVSGGDIATAPRAIDDGMGKCALRGRLLHRAGGRAAAPRGLRGGRAGGVLAAGGGGAKGVLPVPRPGSPGDGRCRSRHGRRSWLPLGTTDGTGRRARGPMEPSRGRRQPALRPARAPRGLAARDSLPRPPAVHARRVGRVLRPGPGDPRDLQPGHRPRHPAGDPLLWTHRRGQVVGTRRRIAAPAKARGRGRISSPRPRSGTTEDLSVPDSPGPRRPATCSPSGWPASAPTGRWS